MPERKQQNQTDHFIPSDPKGDMSGAGRTESRASGGSTSDAAADGFEFRILSSGALAPAGDKGGDMCVADEVFSNGKLLPLRPSSTFAGSFVSRSDDSRSGSGCVSRSRSSNGAAAASSDHGGATTTPPRRSLQNNVFYAHPSPSPQLRRPRPRPRRSTGSAPPAWGVVRLGVVGAPDVYCRPGEARNAAAADRKIGSGLFGDSLGCKCSPDAVEPARLPAKRGGKKDDGVCKVRRSSRILYWFEELSVTKEK